MTPFGFCDVSWRRFMVAMVFVAAGQASVIPAGARSRAVVGSVAALSAGVALGVGEWLVLRAHRLAPGETVYGVYSGPSLT